MKLIRDMHGVIDKSSIISDDEEKLVSVTGGVVIFHWKLLGHWECPTTTFEVVWLWNQVMI
jgi:hypothetical protein